MLCLVLGESTRRGAGMGSIRVGGAQVGCSASPGLYRIRASSPGGSVVCLCSQEGSLGAGGRMLRPHLAAARGAPGQRVL